MSVEFRVIFTHILEALVSDSRDQGILAENFDAISLPSFEI
jgi:hypothetical protein